MSNNFVWGMVTSVIPFRVRLDGDSVALPFAPASLVTVSSLAVDDRVRCEITSQKVVIVGRSTGVTPAASTTVKGIVELATDAEAIAGTDTTRAVTPAGLKAVLALPPRILSGAATASSAAFTTVTFPTGFFTATPRVTVSTTGGTFAFTGTKSTTSVQIATNSASPTQVDWIAVQS